MAAINPWRAWVAAFVGCFALAWLCAEVQIDTIENDLVTRTEQVLANLKIENLHVYASGRDIVLEGGNQRKACARRLWSKPKR